MPIGIAAADQGDGEQEGTRLRDNLVIDSTRSCAACGAA